MYRHAIEVALKEQIRRAETLLSSMRWLGTSEDALAAHKLDVYLESTHSLESLFNASVARLNETTPGAEIPPEVGTAITELHNRDSNGEAFRYARRNGTDRLVFDELENLDIQQIADRLGEVVRFLSWGVGSALSADLDAMSDHLGELTVMAAGEHP